MRGVLAGFLRLGPLLLALAGCVLLAVAEFSTLYEIRVITVVKEEKTGGEFHLYSLLVIAVGAALMAWGATIGRSRPAAFALLALAVLAVALIGIIDVPRVNKEGLLAELYEQAKATPQTGFYLETLGAALLLLSAVAIILLRPATAHDEPRRARTRPSDATPA